ncbi:hypothetical protein M3221_18385 [Domibacillus indicus]|uniref:hypothetical protein n=1 Tax=Domibacillus indicus TaxID=1437523 RepID=UPI00203BDDB8|nr:hypothetical protein [Domibacillus indicus]MCM3790347.1 hypothetical protein [Domibacillus indicus]
MTNFHTGQAVALNTKTVILTGQKKYSVKKYAGPGTLLYPVEDKQRWSVIFKDKSSNEYVIETFHTSELKPYKNKCWGHDCEGQVDSSVNTTCNVCYWVKCPKCGRCKKSLCESSGFTVKTVPIKIRVIPK